MSLFNKRQKFLMREIFNRNIEPVPFEHFTDVFNAFRDKDAQLFDFSDFYTCYEFYLRSLIEVGIHKFRKRKTPRERDIRAVKEELEKLKKAKRDYDDRSMMFDLMSQLEMSNN